MSWKILVTARVMKTVGAPMLDALRAVGCEIEFSEGQGVLKPKELIPLLAGKDAVLVGLDQFAPEVFTAPEAANLKLISRWGVGYDSISIPSATAAGIPVAYVPNLLNSAVADYAFSLLLGIARRIHTGHMAMVEGRWAAQWGNDVHDKSIGIVGCGRIGLAVAKRALGFDMRVIGYDLFPSEAARKMGVEFVSLEELLAQSDYVSLHAALTDQTRGMISEAMLRKMKPSGYLINTARGAIVDEPALAKALNEGWIAGAAVDAYCIEPLPADNPLRTAKNLLYTPHQASWTIETGLKVSHAAVQAILDAKAGRRPAQIVNPEVFNQPQLRLQLA